MAKWHDVSPLYKGLTMQYTTAAIIQLTLAGATAIRDARQDTIIQCTSNPNTEHPLILGMPYTRIYITKYRKMFPE